MTKDEHLLTERFSTSLRQLSFTVAAVVFRETWRWVKIYLGKRKIQETEMLANPKAITEDFSGDFGTWNNIIFTTRVKTHTQRTKAAKLLILN